MDIAKQKLDRTKRTLGDNAKRGQNKKVEDAIADLEKLVSQLPADQSDQFKAEVASLAAETRKQLGLTWVEDTKKKVQRHLKYADDSMAKANAKNVIAAKDLIRKTVDGSEGRSYFEFHESSGPFLAEIDAMYQKIDAWLAANDPTTAVPKPSAASPAAAAAAAAAADIAPEPSSTSSTASTAEASAPTPAAAAASAPAPAKATKTVKSKKDAAAAAASTPSEPEYRRTDDGAFLPTYDTSPSTGLPKQVLTFLPTMVNAYGKTCNAMYSGLVKFTDEAIGKCVVPFDIERRKHELSQTVPNLLTKMSQFEKVIPKARAIDEKLAQMLETEIASAREKVTRLTEDFEKKANAATPVIVLKTSLQHANHVLGEMKSNTTASGHHALRELPSEYPSGPHTTRLWGVLDTILDKIKNAAATISENNGQPFDLAAAVPDYNKLLEEGIKAHTAIIRNHIDSYLKDNCFDSAGEHLALLRTALSKHLVPGREDILLECSKKILDAKEAHEFKLLEEAKGVQVPRRRWSGSDEEAEKLEKAALEYLANNFSAPDRKEVPLIARIVGEWGVARRNILDEPIQYSLPMAVVFYRDPEQGFDEPSFRLFYLCPMAREMGGCTLPFVHAGVGGSEVFLLENLPEPHKTEMTAKIEAWQKKQEEKQQRELIEAAAARKQAALDAEKKWRADHKAWVDAFMTPYTGGKLVASGCESDGETWEYSADGTLRCTKGNDSTSAPFVWNGMFLKQVYDDDRSSYQDLGQGKWDKRKFEWTFHGHHVAYSYFFHENKWEGKSYFNDKEHALSWDGKTLTADVVTLDANKIRFDKLTVDGSVPPFVVLAVAMMGCVKQGHFEVAKKEWEKSQKANEERKLAAMIEIQLKHPFISESKMRHELMRRGIF